MDGINFKSARVRPQIRLDQLTNSNKQTNTKTRAQCAHHFGVPYFFILFLKKFCFQKPYL